MASDRNLRDARFPVQWVTRPMSDDLHDYRGYAGEVASGVLRKGDEVVVLPSGRTSRIAGIDTYDGEIDEAYPPLSVTLRLEDDIDVSRGDMICSAREPADGGEGHPRDGLLDVRAAAVAAGALPHQAHEPHALARVEQYVVYRIDVNSHRATRTPTDSS